MKTCHDWEDDSVNTPQTLLLITQFIRLLDANISIGFLTAVVRIFDTSDYHRCSMIDICSIGTFPSYEKNR